MQNPGKGDCGGGVYLVRKSNNMKRVAILLLDGGAQGTSGADVTTPGFPGGTQIPDALDTCSMTPFVPDPPKDYHVGNSKSRHPVRGLFGEG